MMPDPVAPAREDHAVYKKRIQSFQMTILITMVFVIIIGGTVFGLGVKTRPVLRITKPELFEHVEWILNMMVSTGLAQLSTGGLDCFAACWKAMWPMYLGMGLTAMTICLEIGAIGTSLHLLSSADDIANEDVVHPWFWVECQVSNSCRDALLSYFYYYILPQIVLSSIALFLQCLGIMYMGRLVRAVAEHVRTVQNYKTWYHRGEGEEQGPSNSARMKIRSPVRVGPMEEVEDGEEQADATELIEEVDAGTYNPNFHTPSSILKTDHGYVPASGGSLDYKEMDDSDVRNRSQPKEKEKLSQQQSISFNTDVQVHYYDSKNQIDDETVL